MKSLKKLFKYLIPYKKWLLLAPLFLVLELVMDIFLPAIFGNIINIGVVNNDTNYIIYNIVLMLVLTISGLVGGIFSVYYSAKASEFAANDLRKELFSKITSLNLLDLKKYENGHFITTLTTDINLIANIIMISIRIFFRVPIIVIGSLIMAIIISPKLSLILVAVTPLLGIITAILIKFVFPKFLEIQDGIDEVNSKVREDINGIKTLKSLTKEEEEKKNFDKVNLKLKNTGIKANRFLSLQVPLTTLLVDICIILVLYYGGKSILDGTYESLGISIGTILAFIQYLTNILFALIQASAVIVMLSKSEVSALRINEILEIKTKRRKKAIPEKITSITFDKVCFNYGGKNILDNISFKINKGEIIGITGFTGSGKSTIVSLLEESFEPSSGEILINDYKLKNIDIHKNISIAYQEPILFSGSIRDNVKYSSPNVSDVKMRKYTKMCEIDEFVLKQIGGYNYKLIPKGLNLSGGQRQRIALSRAVLADTDVLVLDDALSSVDMVTEKKILNNFHQKLNDKIIILVSSKTRTLLNCDKVIILKNGKIDAFDTPKNLVNNETFIYLSEDGGCQK